MGKARIKLGPKAIKAIRAAIKAAIDETIEATRDESDAGRKITGDEAAGIGLAIGAAVREALAE